MFLKRLAILTVALALGVAACSGNGTNVVDPLPHGTALTSSGAVVTGAGVAGITSSITVSGSGNVNASESSTPPNSVPVLSSVLRAGANTQSVKTEAAAGNTALVYIAITASSSSSVTGSPASSFTFATLPTGPVFLALFNGTTWQTVGTTPGTVSGNTITFGAATFPAAVALAPGASIYLAVYTGGVLFANGTFETGVLTPWYPCFANHQPSGPVDDNLAVPPNEDTTPLPSTSPTPGATTAPDLTALAIAASVPSGITGGTAAVHGGTFAAVVGHSALVSAAPLRGKGNIGLCQDFSVPATNPSLTMWVFEGGNTPSLYSNDAESEIYPAGSFTTSGPSGATAMSTTATPSKILFLEDNCYDNLNKGTSFTPPGHDCTPPTGVAVQGGVWKQKGPYSLTALAGQPVTLFIGIMGTSTSTTFYNYAYFDDVSLTGS